MSDKPAIEHNSCAVARCEVEHPSLHGGDLPEPRTEYQEGDLEKFFGIDPDFTGDMSTEDYLDNLRGDQRLDAIEQKIK